MSKTKKRNLTMGGILLIFLLCTILFATISGTGVSANAASTPSLESIIFTGSNAFQFTPIDGTTDCSVKLIDKSQTNVRVPKTATINGIQYNVTEVASNGFSSTSGLKTVILPISIKKIGSAAFQNCSKLELAYAPEVQEIGMSAFAFCTSLRDIIFPSTLNTVGSSVFMMSPTKVHARFDAAQTGWASNWNAGNTQNHDFNERDTDGNLWMHDFVYEEIPQANPLLRTTTVATRLAPMQPFMEKEYKGHLEIPNTELDLMPGRFIDCKFQSVTFLSGTTPINLWSSVFVDVDVIEGIEINREVTYDCKWQPSGISETVFHTVNTPFITLPTPQNIVPGMFISNTVENINFRTATGITYENKGVVKLPDDIEKIGYNAFESTNNIKHLYIPAKIDSIGNQAFANWNKTQTIHMPFLNEEQAISALGKGWQSLNSAIIEYEGSFSIVSQPTSITDANVHKLFIELKMKDYNKLIQYTCVAGYQNAWGNYTSLEMPATADKGISQIDGYWVHKWEKDYKITDGGTGGLHFMPLAVLKKDGVEVMSITGEMVYVNKVIRTVADFNAWTPTSYDEYDTSLLANINLGTFTNSVTGGIKMINYKNMYGNGYTITYSINQPIMPARYVYTMSLFKENKGTISNLKVNASFTVSNYETLIENGVQQGARVSVSGIAAKNIAGARIENCEVTMNAYVNSPNSDIGGVATENNGLIANCVVKGNISTAAIGGTNIGGIATYNWFLGDPEITGCTNMATISGYANIGGIAVQNASKISSCTNEATLTYNSVNLFNGLTSHSIGGIVGYNQGSITNSKNTGIVKFGTFYNNNHGWIQPCMGQIIGTDDYGSRSGNTYTGTVNTVGLSSNYQGWNEILYARNAEYGKIL